MRHTGTMSHLVAVGLELGAIAGPRPISKFS